jgi:predicted O-linked N-acetylglucosamine transferase (SPINDLY family)
MRFSSIAVSNVRIAPIQVMSFGHPATTHSEAMDYVILNSFGQNPASTSEKTMDVPSLDVFSPRSDSVSIAPNIRLDPEVVRIAVPAWSRKVTPRFLETCQRIQRTAKKKVEFWFFPNALGYLYHAVKRRYEGMIPGSVVLPTKNYNDYIRDINQCDLFLSTFPFGATNGLVDALLQGLPVVNLVGDEVHSCSDSAIVSLVGQPAFLSAKTIDDYVNAVVRLADDPVLRVQISRNIVDKNPGECLFIKNGKASEFAQIFNSIYKAG